MKTNYKAEEICEIVDEQQDKRRKAHREMDRWQSAWAREIWKETKNEALHIKGKENVVTPATTNTVQLAMRLIDTRPKIKVPTVGDNAETDAKASKRERWLNTMWENISADQPSDVISAASWQSFVLGRHVMQMVWIKDALPKSLVDTRMPFTVRTLDPRNAGTYHNGYYTKYGWHSYEDTFGAVKDRHAVRGMKLGSKVYDREQTVGVKDFWWQHEEGVYHAVIVDDHYVKKPTKTNYLMVPIVEGFGDYAPLSEEEYKSLSIIAPMLESWLYDCRLKSQMATGILYYFWPFLIAQNDMGQPIEDFRIEPGLIKAMPQGTRIESVIGSPNSQLVQNMGATMEQYIQQSSFPEVLHGKAPGDVQAGYGIDILAQSARGRINNFRRNLEMTIQKLNMIALNMLEWPNVSPRKGITVYGYSPQALAGRYYTLTKDDVDGEYRTIVNLKVDMDGNNLQKQTFWLRLVESGVISKRTYLETILPDEVPEDEMARVFTQQALESDEMKPKTFLYALQDTFPTEKEKGGGERPVAEWPDLIRNTPFEAMAKAEGLLGETQPPEVPPANGSMEALMGGPPPGMHVMPDGSLMPDAEMGGNGGAPPSMPPPPPIQPEMPMSPVMPVENQGGLTPEALGVGANFPPELWDALMNQDPETIRELLARMQGGM